MMQQSSLQRVSTEMVDQVAGYLEPSDQLSFRSSCEQADEQTFQDVTRRFFSTWRTSLLGSDLQKLEDVSRNPDLRKHIKALHIQDDCEKNDPWNKSTPLHSDNIWPRDDAGEVRSSETGVASLRAMLDEGRLCPETITVRDYRIERYNFLLCPATARTRDYRIEDPSFRNHKPAAALARDVANGVNIAIVSVSMRTVQLEQSENAMVGNERVSPRAPDITEVIVTLSPQHQGQGLGFSLLRSAELKVTQYWLEQVLCHATDIESLKVDAQESWETIPSIKSGASLSSLSKLKRLHIQSSRMNVSTVLAVLNKSKQSLTDLSFKWLVLDHASSWNELLRGIDLPKLTSFALIYLKQARDGGYKAIDDVSFLGYDEDAVPEECRLGLLDLREKGPLGDRRLTRVSYQGPAAELVLKSLASFAQLRSR